MSNPVRIAASVLAADFSRLGEEVEAIDRAGADWIHLDVMDGHFVPNITFGPAVVASLRSRTQKPFDAHLMIAPADPYLAAFAESGANSIIVHVEAGPHLARSLDAIGALGKRAGVAINPATPLSAIAPVLDRIDLAIVMTVNPGFGGQAFMPDMLGKVRELRAMAANRSIDIEVDGGIGPDNAQAAVAAGANILVAGSSLFRGGRGRYGENIAALRSAARSAEQALA